MFPLFFLMLIQLTVSTLLPVQAARTNAHRSQSHLDSSKHGSVWVTQTRPPSNRSHSFLAISCTNKCSPVCQIAIVLSSCWFSSVSCVFPCSKSLAHSGTTTHTHTRVQPVCKAHFPSCRRSLSFSLPPLLVISIKCQQYRRRRRR